MLPQSKTASLYFAGKSLPSDALAPIVAALGPFPSAHLQQDAWTTKALIDVLWKDGLPAVSILWLGEPDLTEHESAPGAPAVLAAIKFADENLAALLSALDQSRVGGTHETTDVFVVSDHGFSTIERSIDLRKILSNAGFVAKTEFENKPKPGDIMLVGNGGSVLFYIKGHDAEVKRRLVEFLQQTDFAGVILTKEAMPGTFVLDQAKIDPPEAANAPDVVMAFRWNHSKNQFGVPGMIDADWQRAAGKGTHATLSRFDMHNTLIAAGPEQLDGRILSEAMSNGDMPALKPETKTIKATKDFPSGSWRQSLQISRVGSTIYLDEGNGAFSPKQGAALSKPPNYQRESNLTTNGHQ